MKINLSERNIVVILFVVVLITFSLAQEQSRVMERVYTGKGNIHAKNSDTLVKNTHAQIAGSIKQVPAKLN